MALLLVLLADHSLGVGPVHPEGRVGDQVVHPKIRQAIFREGIAALDVLGVLALDHHVGLADGVGLVVQLLPIGLHPGLGIQLAQELLGHG